MDTSHAEHAGHDEHLDVKKHVKAYLLVFAGLTAYDTQRLKNEYVYGQLEGEAHERSAIMGALSLYLNFINLFTLLLQLLGQREE